MTVYLLSDDLIFPSPHLADKGGLLAVGGDLQPERLLLAYKNGIFPWYSDEDPILWWSPDPRMVLYPEKLKVSRSLKKTLRKGRFEITMDSAFEQVIKACARTRTRAGEGTWITQEMIDAYCRLHALGYAHSVETWFEGRLAGGLYGVSLGRCYFGESMFSTISDASKVALVHLRHFLYNHDFHMIDCQVPTDHLERMGARKISRQDFLRQLGQSLKYPSLIGPWRSCADPKIRFSTFGVSISD